MMGAAQGRRPYVRSDSMIPLNCPSVTGIEISFLAALEARHDHVIKTSQWGKGAPSISFSSS